MENVHEWNKTAPYQVTCFNKVGNKIKISISPRINFLHAHTHFQAADCSRRGCVGAVTAAGSGRGAHVTRSVAGPVKEQNQPCGHSAITTQFRLFLCLFCPLGWQTPVGRPLFTPLHEACGAYRADGLLGTLNFVLIEMLTDTEAPPGGR